MNKTTKDVLELAAWFLGTVLFQSLFIPYGVELGDTGFFLTNQRGIHAYKELCNIGFMTFLTDWVGGCWLGIVSSPSYAWARLGGAIAGASIVSATFWTLKDYFARGHLRFALILPATLVGGGIINYYSFPAVLLALILWFCLKISSADSSRSSGIWSLSLGFLVWIAVLARFPLVVLPFTLLGILGVSCVTGKIPKTVQRSILLGMAGFAVGALVSVAALKVGGLYDPIIAEIKAYFFPAPGTRVDDSHGLGRLAFSYLDRAIKGTIGACLWIAGLYVIGLLKSKKLNWARWVSVLALVFFLAYFKTTSPGAAIMRFREMVVFTMAITCLYFAWNKRKIEPRQALLALVSVVLMFAIAAGSNTGLQTAFCGASACLCLTILFLDSLGDLSQSNILRTLASVRRECAVSVVLVFLSYPYVIPYIYGQESLKTVYGVPSGRAKMNEAYKSPSLAGMLGEPEFVRELDAVIANVTNSAAKDQTVFALNCIGGINYLTSTRPFLKTTLLGNLSTNVAISMYEEARKNRGPVQAVVWFKPLEDDLVLATLRDKAVNDYSLTQVHKGKFFDVFAKKAIDVRE